MEICQTEELFCLRNPNNEANEVAQSFVLVHLHHPGSLAKPLREPGAPKPPLSTSLAAFVIFPCRGVLPSPSAQRIPSSASTVSLSSSEDSQP